MRRRNIFLLLLGFASFAIFWPASAHAHPRDDAFLYLAGVQALLCLAACALLWNAPPSRSTFSIVLGLAGLLRLALLFEKPQLSTDMYRYIWDGRVQAAGINPYRYIPADPNLAALRDDAIYPHINRREYAPTIYPPGAQLLFFAVTRVSESTTWFKITLLGCEALTLWCLVRWLAAFGLPRERVVIYAWNPLVLWEFSGSGHIDAAMIAFLMLAFLARRRAWPALAGALLAGAALIKLYPLVLFPALYRRWDWKMPLAAAATASASYFLYRSAGRGVVGFLPAYAGEEGMGSGRYFLLLLAQFLAGGREAPVSLYFAVAFFCLAAIGAFSFLRWSAHERTMILSGGLLALTFTFFLSPHYAWYWIWIVPFLVFLPWPAVLPLFYVTTGGLVQYGTWFDDGRWFGFAVNSHLALGLLQFGPAALLFILLLIFNRKRRRLLPASAHGWIDAPELTKCLPRAVV